RSPSDRMSSRLSWMKCGRLMAGAGPSAVDLHLAGPDDLGPLDHLRRDELAEFLARSAAVLGAVSVELLLHVGLGEHGVDVAIDLVCDRRRQLARSDQA